MTANKKPIKGVDVSDYNGKIDLSLIKSKGFEFVMIKIGYGNNEAEQDEKLFNYFVEQARKNDMLWGAYIYSYATTKQEALSEVAHVRRVLGNIKPPLGVAFDMEDADQYKSKNKSLYKSRITDICETFLSETTKYYNVMLYTSFSWLDNFIDEKVYKKYPLWIAQWSTICEYVGDNLVMWQYGGETNYLQSPKIDGIGVIDQNYYYGDIKVKNTKKNNKKKSDEEIAQEVLNGKWGNGNERKIRLTKAGYNYNEVQKIVNYYIVAKDVIKGKYGNGEARKNALKKAGYNYDKVQKIVNKLLK